MLATSVTDFDTIANRHGMTRYLQHHCSLHTKYLYVYTREEIANCTKMAVLASRALTMRHGVKLECTVARYPEKS